MPSDIDIDVSNSTLKLTTRLRMIVALLVILLPTILLSVVILQPFVAPKWMFFDMLTAAEFSDDCCHIYYGFVSNLGIFLWVATSAIALFATYLLWRFGASRGHVTFALSAALLSGWLGLDDAFLLHEVAFPELGVPQTLVLMAYVALGGLYALLSWRVIWSSEFWILFLAGVGVASSLGIDLILHSIDDTIIIIEDSAKFFGIFAWFSYHALTLGLMLTPQPDPKLTPSSA